MKTPETNPADMDALEPMAQSVPRRAVVGTLAAAIGGGLTLLAKRRRADRSQNDGARAADSRRDRDQAPVWIGHI